MADKTNATGRQPERLAISFWLWNYFYGINAGEYFHQMEPCFVELKERGFNCIRVDSGAGLCHDASGRPRGEIALHEPFPGFSFLRQMHQGKTRVVNPGCRVDVLKKVVELFELARRYDVQVILSCWFYLHTYWFLEEALAQEFFALPPAERFMRFARENDRLLTELEARGLAGQVACVELLNEFEGFLAWHGAELVGASEAQQLQVKHEFRRHHEEALAFLHARHPQIRLAIDTCGPEADREVLPRNAQVWNHHFYYCWGIYGQVLDGDIYRPEFDFSSARQHPRLGRFLRPDACDIEAVRNCRPVPLNYARDWYARVWLYNNLDPDRLPELETRLAETLQAELEQYKRKVDEGLRRAQETRRALFPDIILLMGEGATYCAHLDMRWEERSKAYWELVAHASARLREYDYWGCVPRTNSGPEDPSWTEFPERLRQANQVFLGAETAERRSAR